MSITKKTIKKYISLAAAGLAMWLTGCAVAWQYSRIGGGYQTDKAETIVKEISQTTRLTPACFMLATKLVEASLKARTAAWYPTAGRMAGEELVAAAHYEGGRCPVAALLAVSYGVAEQANATERKRQANRASRWRS
jgi:hypothetical protein